MPDAEARPKLPERPDPPDPETTRRLFPGFAKHDVQTDRLTDDQQSTKVNSQGSLNLQKRLNLNEIRSKSDFQESVPTGCGTHAAVHGGTYRRAGGVS